MKKFITLIRRATFVVAVAALTGCKSLVLSSSQLMDKIHRGMTQEEVVAAIGAPDFKRFTDNYEEWEWRKRTFEGENATILVGFENGRVFMMNSFPTRIEDPQGLQTQMGYPLAPPIEMLPYAVPVPSKEETAFDRLYADVERSPFKDDRLKLLSKRAVDMKFTCAQCLKLMSLYTFDDDRLPILRILSPYIVDPENRESIVNSMIFISGKNAAKKVLACAGDAVIKKPPHGDRWTFNRLFEEMKGTGFKDNQLKILKQHAADMRFTCGQCVKVMSLQTFDDDKLALLRAMVPYIVDPENEQVIIDALGLLREREIKNLMKHAGYALEDAGGRR